MDILLVVFSPEGFIKLAFGALIGLCLGLTGVGGGVLIIPILQAVFGMQTIMAVGTASIISSIVKANAGLSHIVAGNVDWKALKWMLIGAVPATYFTTEGIVYLNKVQSIAPYINQAMEMAIVVIMLLSLYSIVLKFRRTETSAPARSHSSKVAVSAGATCGTILGSTGVGGGVMLLPAFNSLLGVSIKKSVGSSLVMALILSTLTALNYSRGGQSDMVTALLMSAGAFIGVPVAMKLLKKFDDKKVYLLTIFIITVSLILVLAG